MHPSSVAASRTIRPRPLRSPRAGHGRRLNRDQSDAVIWASIGRACCRHRACGSALATALFRDVSSPWLAPPGRRDGPRRFISHLSRLWGPVIRPDGKAEPHADLTPLGNGCVVISDAASDRLARVNGIGWLKELFRGGPHPAVVADEVITEAFCRRSRITAALEGSASDWLVHPQRGLTADLDWRRSGQLPWPLQHPGRRFLADATEALRAGRGPGPGLFNCR